jgi:hypothetical protein
MKLRIAVAIVLMCGLVSTAEAGIGGWFKRSKKPATPASLVDQKVDDGHKYGKSQRHPAKYDRADWGRLEGALKVRDFHFNHSITDY